MSDLNDIIERAKRGDAQAFEALYREHQGTVRRVVMRFLGPSPEVDDVVQDVFVQVFRSLESFRGESKFSTWLYRLSANVTKMHIRRKASRPRTVGGEIPDEGTRSSEAPDADVSRRRRVDAFYRFVNELGEKKREVFVLHELEGVSAKDIAEVVGAPVMTVRTRLFYARKELYAAIETDPDLADVVEALSGELRGGKRKTKKAGSA